MRARVCAPQSGERMEGKPKAEEVRNDVRTRGAALGRSRNALWVRLHFSACCRASLLEPQGLARLPV